MWDEYEDMPKLSLKKHLPSDETIDGLLDGAHFLLKNSSDVLSLAPIPGLDTAATVLCDLIDMVKMTRKNTAAKHDVAERIKSLATLITETGERARRQIEGAGIHETSVPVPSELNRRIQVLIRNLQDLQTQASQVAEGSLFSRFVHSGRDAGRLEDLSKGIVDAKSDFEFQGQIHVEALVDGMFDMLNNVRWDVSVLARVKIGENDMHTLDSLPHADVSYRSALNELKSGLLPGTRSDLLSEIDEWAKGEPSAHNFALYVLSGAAGTGKSTIVYEVARRLEQNGMLGASFFFVRGAEDLSTTHFVFSTIAYQLAQQQPVLMPHILEATRAFLKRGNKQQMEFELDKLIIRPLKKVPASHHPVIVIIDAIDECTELAQDLIPKMLYLLARQAPEVPFPFRVLITSRPEYHIETAFESVEFRKGSNRFRLQDIPRVIVDHDIMQFLEDRVSKLRDGSELLHVRPDAIVELTKKAEGLFIYASTAINVLLRDPEHAVENLNTLFADGDLDSLSDLSQLDVLYMLVLKNAFKDYLGTPPNPRIAHMLKTVLAGIALLQDHLSPSTMESLVGVSVTDIRFIIRRLGSVILLDEDDSRIRPLHASFPQFLIDSDRCRDSSFYIDPAVHHVDLANACLSTLNRRGNLRRNICDLPNPAAFKDEIENLAALVQRQIPSHVQYACVHWAFHLCRAEFTLKLTEYLGVFCSTKLLLWLQTLSFMDRLDGAPGALLDLRNWYQSRHTGDKDTLQLIYDGYRFALEYFNLVDSCPEHIYISALPTAPCCRLVDTYSALDTESKCVKMLSSRAPRWDLCVRVVEGQDEGVRSVVYSPNGRWIVAGINDGTVRTWDASSGVPLNIMAGHSTGVYSVDVSPDNSRIISYGRDVRVWNLATGAPLYVLDVGGMSLRKISFSADGSKILAMSASWSIRMWDAHLFRELQIFGEGSHVATRFANFPCSGTLISSRDMSDISILDRDSGDILKTLRGHSEPPQDSIFFPHDTSRLASGGMDNTVRIWDIASGECLFVLTGHTDWVNCLAISPNGDRVASGSEDRTIRIWDAQSGDCVAVLRGHSKAVRSLYFSPDGNQLVSTSGDHTVRIWDLMALVAPLTTSDAPSHAAEINQIVLSEDGQFIASFAIDNVLIVQRASNGEFVQRIQMSDAILTGRFSPDATRIATMGGRRVLTVYEVMTGTMLHEVDTDDMFEVAYLHERWILTWTLGSLQAGDPCRIHLRAASDLSLVNLFEIDPTRNRTARTFDRIKTVSFSPDGDRLFISTFGQRTFLWDCLPGQNPSQTAVDWDVKPPADPHDFMERDGWFTRGGGRKVFWLTESRRPSTSTSMEAYEDVLAVGARSGQVTIVKLGDILRL